MLVVDTSRAYLGKFALRYFYDGTFYKIIETCCTSKYRDKSIEASSTCFLQIITVRYIGYEILFQAYYNGIVIVGRKQVDGAPVRGIWFGYFHKKHRQAPILSQKVPACFDAFTKTTGMFRYFHKNYRHKSIAIQKCPAILRTHSIIVKIIEHNAHHILLTPI